LVFERVIDPRRIGAPDPFGATSRAIRDVNVRRRAPTRRVDDRAGLKAEAK
jgi:hypothetical protein